MKSIDLTYIIPIVTLLLSVVAIFFYGKRRVLKGSLANIFRYIPLASVTALLFGVFYVTSYYQKELLREKDRFLALQQQNYYNDSILLSSKSKDQALDSLRVLSEELNRILILLNKQEKVTGEYASIKEKVQGKISKTNQEIGSIESYNEIIDTPEYLKKGYSASGNTSNFIFTCPTDKVSEYIDLKIRFQDTALIKKIACIYLTITEVRENGDNWLTFRQAYKPQNGVNAFKIKNFLKDNNITLEIGYVLRSQTNREFPTFERVSCKSN